MEIKLNVFTLNCWGIPVVSKHRKERIHAIAKYLVSSQHTIVCLQEIWSENDYLFLKTTLLKNLPYSYYFYRYSHKSNSNLKKWSVFPKLVYPQGSTGFNAIHLGVHLPFSTPCFNGVKAVVQIALEQHDGLHTTAQFGVLGSGLCIFSKWLIQDVFFHQWPLNGYIHKIHHGDWFGGKGVGLCRIKCGARLINVYCTHLHAEYHVDDIYLAHRVLQAYSTAELVNLTKAPADVSILAGDLNTEPGDLPYRIIMQLPSLVDPFDLPCEGTNPTINKPAGTSETANNSYTDKKQAQTAPEGKRIDHILFHVSPTWEAEVINFGNPLEEKVPGEPFSYSDHNAVTLELKIKPARPRSGSSQRQSSRDSSFDLTVAQAIKVCDEATQVIAKSKKLFLTSGGLLFMFLLGTVGFWPNKVMYDVIKIIITGFCFYYILMGSLWNKIELNSLKAGLNALKNFNKTSTEAKDDATEEIECKDIE